MDAPQLPPPPPPTAAAGEPAAPVAAPGPQAPFLVKLLLVAWIVVYLLAALALLLDIWVLQRQTLLNLLGLPAGAALSSGFLSALHAMLGAVLGAGVMDIVSFHTYASVKGDFQSRHVWGYLLAPLLAAVLGLIVFALLQSGLLVFAGHGKGEPDELARLGYLAVGFLAGFGWYEATSSIRAIVRRFFSGAAGSPPPKA